MHRKISFCRQCKMQKSTPRAKSLERQLMPTVLKGELERFALDRAVRTGLDLVAEVFADEQMIEGICAMPRLPTGIATRPCGGSRPSRSSCRRTSRATSARVRESRFYRTESSFMNALGGYVSVVPSSTSCSGLWFGPRTCST
jgi:hypothetical protein